jgi:hypothetical protein
LVPPLLPPLLLLLGPRRCRVLACRPLLLLLLGAGCQAGPLAQWGGPGGDLPHLPHLLSPGG